MGDGIGGLGPGGGDSIESLGGHYKYTGEADAPRGAVNSSNKNLQWQFKERTEDGKHLFKVTTLSGREVLDLTFDPDVSISSALQTIEALGTQYASCIDEDAILQQRDNFLEGGNTVKLKIDDGKRPKNPLQSPGLNLPSWVPGKSAINYTSRLFGSFNPSENKGIVRVFVCETHNGQLTDKAHLAVECNFDTGKITKYNKENHLVGHTFFDIKKVSTKATEMMGTIASTHDAASRILEHIQQNIEYVFDPTQAAVIDSGDPSLDIDRADATQLDIRKREKEERAKKLGEELSIEGIEAPRTLTIEADEEEVDIPDVRARLSLVDPFEIPEELRLSLNPELVDSFDLASRESLVDKFLEAFEHSTIKDSLKDALLDPTLTLEGAETLINREKKFLTLIPAHSSGEEEDHFSGSGEDGMRTPPQHDADIQIGVLKQDELTEFANSLGGDYTPEVRKANLNELFKAYQDTPELQSLKGQLSAEGITEEKAIELIAGAIDSLSPLPEGEEVDLEVGFSDVDWEDTERREEVFDNLFADLLARADIPEDKLEELAALKEECLKLDSIEEVLSKKGEFLDALDDSYEVSFAERRRNSIGDIIADNEGLEDKLKEAFKKATLEERKDAIKDALSDICCPLTIDSLLAQLAEGSSLQDLIDSDDRRLSAPEEMELSFEEKVEKDGHFATALKTALATSTQDLGSRKESLRDLLKGELHYPDATIERVLNAITLDSNYEQLVELIKREERTPDMSAQICDATEEEAEAIKAALEREEASISFKERETLSTAEASISAILGKARIPKPEALYKQLENEANWDNLDKREGILRDILRPYNNLEKVLKAVMQKSSPEEAITLLELRREYANDQIEEAIRAQVSTPQNPTTKRGRIIAALKKEYDKTLEEYRLAAHPNWHELAAQRTRYGTYPDPNAAVLDHIGRREGEMEKIYLKLCALTNSLNKQVAKDDDGHAVENAPKLKYPPKHNSFATVDELDQGNPEFSDIEISFAKARELRTSIGALQQELYEITSQGPEAIATYDTRVQELRANISEKTRSLRKLLDAPEEEIRERTSGLSREILLPERLEERYQDLEKLAKEDSLTSSHKRTATKGPFGRYSSSKLKSLRKLEVEYREKTSLVQNFEKELESVKGKDSITEEEADIFVEEMKSFYLGIFGTEKGPNAATKEKLKKLVGKGDDREDYGLTAAEFIGKHKAELLKVLQSSDQRAGLLDEITTDIKGDIKVSILPELSTKIDQKKRGLSSYVKNMRRFPFEKGALDKKDVKRAQHWIAGCQAQQFFLDTFLDRNTDLMRDTASRLSTVNLCDKEAGLSPYGMMQVDLGAAENPSPLSELIPEDRIANAQDAAVNLSSLNANLLPQCFEDIETRNETLLSYLEKFTEEGELIDPKNLPTEEEKSAAQAYIIAFHGNPPAEEVKLVADRPVIEQLYHELQEIAIRYKSKGDRKEAISRFRELQVVVKQHMSKVTKGSPQGKILTKLNERLQAFTPFEEAFDSENFLERSEGPHASFSEIISEGERDTKTYNTLICVNDISIRLQEIRDIKERVLKPAGDDYSGRALYNKQIERFNRTIETEKSKYDSELARLVAPYQADIASIDQAVEKAYQIIRESQNQEGKIPREFMMDGNFNPLEAHRNKLIEIQETIIRPLKEKSGKIKSSYADLPEWFKNLATHIEQLEKDIANIEGKIGGIQEASMSRDGKDPGTLYEALNKGEGFVDGLKKALFTHGRKKTRSKFKAAVQGRSGKKSRVKQGRSDKFTFIDALDGISALNTLSMISSLS
ncbi:MAG: hypothetical protein L7U87_03145 [Chlamydiales bacterium]|nr:hypothetical protein [Chlamydiales bacterium]